jgi:uncharacterized repeat protein (TIGR03803 family)
MKSFYHFMFILVLVGLVVTPGLRGQTFNALYNFSATNYDAALGYPIVVGLPPAGMTNFDGVKPSGALLLAGNTLYGTAYQGGLFANGTVFAVGTNGGGFTNLYNFTGDDVGSFPYAGLVLGGSNLYGTASAGGNKAGYGTVFVVSTNGTGFAPLHDFTGESSDGSNPFGPLILSGNTLYGMAGSSDAGGTVYGINTSGPTFSRLLLLSDSQGEYPNGGFILSGTNLYGMATQGGLHSNGTVFKISTNGTGFTLLHTFTAGAHYWPYITNSDGAYPSAGLLLSGTTLYGTTSTGGSSASGTIFAVNADGSGFTNLYNFSATNGSGCNNDGARPESTLVLAGQTLYGTACLGGSAGDGTIFAINTNGTGFVTLHAFTGGSDGAGPLCGLTLGSNILYGVTSSGGTNDTGAIFSLTLPPALPVIANLSVAGTNLVINAIGEGAGTYETLMSTNPLAPFSQWTVVATNILITSGNFSVTNAMDPNLPQCFYVLHSQ